MGSCIHKPLAIITGINIELRLYYCKYRKIGVSHNYMLKRFKNDQNIYATSNAHKILATLFPKWKTKTIFRLESPQNLSIVTSNIPRHSMISQVYPSILQTVCPTPISTGNALYMQISCALASAHPLSTAINEIELLHIFPHIQVSPVQ